MVLTFLYHSRSLLVPKNSTLELQQTVDGHTGGFLPALIPPRPLRLAFPRGKNPLAVACAARGRGPSDTAAV